MGAAELLQGLRRKRLTLRASGVSLLVKPAGALTDEDAASIAALKEDLLALLRAEVGDDRVTCTTCRHYHPTAARCQNFRAALLCGPVIAPSLARLPQHCPAFEARHPTEPASNSHQAGSPEPTTATSTAPANHQEGQASPETGPGRPAGGPAGTNAHPRAGRRPLQGAQQRRPGRGVTEPDSHNSPRQHSRPGNPGQPSTEPSTSAPGCTPLHRTGGAHA